MYCGNNGHYLGIIPLKICGFLSGCLPWRISVLEFRQLGSSSSSLLLLLQLHLRFFSHIQAKSTTAMVLTPVLELISEKTLAARKDSRGDYSSISLNARRGELSGCCRRVPKPVLRLQAARLQFHRRNHPRRLHRRGRLDRRLCGHPPTRLGQERCCGGTQLPHGRTYTDLYRSPDRTYSGLRGAGLS